MPDWRHGADVRGLVGLAQEPEAKTGLRAVVDQDAALVPGRPGVGGKPVRAADQDGRLRGHGRRGEVPGPVSAWASTWSRAACVEVVGYHNRNTSIHREVRDLHSLRDLVRKALASQGRYERAHWRFEPLPQTHPLFHSYYDIPALPSSYWRMVCRLWKHPVGTLDLEDIPG